ncbi:MAG: hypothetical protein LBJ36_03625 [Synergistaceae bacterium]|nr:hypothetical protein [Synergistaceae bacterium]
MILRTYEIQCLEAHVNLYLGSSSPIFFVELGICLAEARESFRGKTVDSK